MVHFMTKLLHAAVLQANGVEHARWGFGHARVGVALAVGASGAFHDETAQSLEVYEVGVFFAIAESAAGCQHRVAQFEIVNLDF